MHILIFGLVLSFSNGKLEILYFSGKKVTSLANFFTVEKTLVITFGL